MCVCVCVCVHAHLCPTPCSPMDCSLPGSSVHEISQARILEWVVFLSPADLPNLSIEHSSLVSPAFAGGFLTTTQLENLFISIVPPGKSSCLMYLYIHLIWPPLITKVKPVLCLPSHYKLSHTAYSSLVRSDSHLWTFAIQNASIP